MMANLESNFGDLLGDILDESAREMRHHGHDWFRASHEEWCREHNQPIPKWVDDELPKVSYGSNNCPKCGGPTVAMMTDDSRSFECIRCACNLDESGKMI